MDGWNTTFLLGRPIFRGYVSFREGILPSYIGKIISQYKDPNKPIRISWFMSAKSFEGCSSDFRILGFWAFWGFGVLGLGTQTTQFTIS